ncbi:MAG: hypothetical protein AMXMBFR82_22680 [Candidatus Hydrogenedentota bacterium]
MADEQPRIIIDEDWKAQVQREKEQAQVKQPEEPTEAAEDSEAADDEAPSTFGALIQSLAAQCAFALGLIAPPDTKQVMVNLEEARYCVDTLIMLREKTKGNLTPQEQGILTQTLAELQQVYAVRAQQIQEAQLRQAGIDLKNPPKA